MPKRHHTGHRDHQTGAHATLTGLLVDSGLMTYLARDDQQRRAAADELTRSNQEMGCSDMAFVVVHDANVLYPSTLRDLLIQIAQGDRLASPAVTAG